MKQKMYTYGNPIYEKDVSEKVFFISQKVFGCNLRSGEQGSVSYRSEESIQSETVLKNISLAYEHSEQTSDARKIRYDSKCGEAMYALNAEKGAEAMNRFSSADYLWKDTMMSPSFMSVKSAFNGTNYLKARVLADVKNSSEEAVRMERLLTGNFTLDTVTLAVTIKYAYPHIYLTKKVLELYLDDYSLNYSLYFIRLLIGSYFILHNHLCSLLLI